MSNKDDVVIKVREPITIALGEKKFFIRPTTLGQLVRIAEELDREQPMIPKALNIVAVGLSRDNPDEAEKIDELEASMAQIVAAMGDILRLAGFPTPDVMPTTAEAA